MLYLSGLELYSRWVPLILIFPNKNNSEKFKLTLEMCFEGIFRQDDYYSSNALRKTIEISRKNIAEKSPPQSIIFPAL